MFSIPIINSWFRARKFRQAAVKAELRVAVIHNWAEFEAAAENATPGRSCLWDGVAFVPFAKCKQPDFVLVLNSPRKAITVNIAPERLWFASGEPPEDVFRGYHEGQGTGTVVLTCDCAVAEKMVDRRFLVEPPILNWHVIRSYDQLLSDAPPDKPKVLSWVTSNLSQLPGHKRRMSFLAALRTQVPFDLFGRGFTPIADKWDALAPYRYSIAFENTCAPLYFTEKIMDCFLAGTMPLYFGAPDIGAHFPPQAIVSIDPDRPDVFSYIKDVIASDLWRERQPYIQEAKALVLRKYNGFARLARHFRLASEIAPSAQRRFDLRCVEPDWRALNW